MSSAPLTIQQLQRLSSKPTIEDDVRSAATFLSITLALLTAFANQRAASLVAQDGKLGSFTLQQLKRDLKIDVALLCFAGAALIAIAPLAVVAAKHISLFHEHTAILSAFCVLFFGVGLIACWLVHTAWNRWRNVKAKAA
jgi:hypothetical protein